jgi:hypothetical protein
MTAKTVTKTARASAKKVAPLLAIDVACREIEAAADQMTIGLVTVADILRRALGKWMIDATGKDKENQDKLRAAMQRGVHVRYYIMNGHAENREGALHLIAEAKKLAHDSTEPARLTFKKADGVFRVQWLRALEQAGLKTKKPRAPHPVNDKPETGKPEAGKPSLETAIEKEEAKAAALLAKQVASICAIKTTAEALPFLEGLIAQMLNTAMHNAAAFNGEGEKPAVQRHIQAAMRHILNARKAVAQAKAALTGDHSGIAKTAAK